MEQDSVAAAAAAAAAAATAVASSSHSPPDTLLTSDIASVDSNSNTKTHNFPSSESFASIPSIVSSSSSQSNEEESIELYRERFKALLEQYSLREQHFSTVAKSCDMEIQLMEGKLEQQKHITAQEVMKSQSLRAQVSSF